MIEDASALAAAIGLPLEVIRDNSGVDSDVTVTFFKPDDGDPTHFIVTCDGNRLPLGVPVEELRKKLAPTDGAFIGPSGRAQLIEIPAEIPDGDGYYVSISFKRSG